MSVLLSPLLRHLRRLATPGSLPEADAVLLERFVQARDEEAFACLVARHGSMVLGVCRRVLGDAHAAEDVFQATFLTLARRAATIRTGAALAGWLHAVALRLALKVRRAAQPPHAQVERSDGRPDPLAELSARELTGLVDQELERLADVYRLPVLLCCLEGLSQEEAARRLGWSPGSLKGRLERGRKRLHARLVKRGLTLAVALAAVETTRGAAPVTGTLVHATVRAALAFTGLTSEAVPAVAAQLANDWLHATALGHTKLVMGLLFSLALALGGGVLAWGYSGSGASVETPRQVVNTEPAPQPKPLAALPPVKVDGKSSPPFRGTALPRPPQQTKRWTPPTGVPAVLGSATSALFAAGMADPRGGEYRVIEVGTGSCWSGDAGRLRTHGWVLPADGGAPRFAVGWNGLVYPVISVGARADLHADVRAILKRDTEARAKAARDRPADKFRRYHPAWSEQRSLADDSLVPLKACLLARLGEADLARAWWEAWTGPLDPRENNNGATLKDPYLMLAADWAWALFDRALGAHMRGDDRLALLSARALTRAQAVIEDEAARRGFERQPAGPAGKVRPFLSFLEQLPALVADQERRAAEGPRAQGWPANANQGTRIAALIRDLDDTAARQLGQPGGVSLNMGGPVSALVQEGEAAIEPLLKCLEEDQRLTRSVRFHRDFFMYRRIANTSEAAYAALSDILHTTNFGPDVNPWELETGGAAARQRVATAIRRYYGRFKGVPLVERWYRTLADDAVTPSEWLEAATKIVQRDGQGQLHGASLRGKHEPAVSSLLTKRIDGLWQPYQADAPYLTKLDQACRLAYCLADWDAKAATPILTELFRLAARSLAEQSSNGNAYQTLAPAMTRITELRLKAGDRTALGQYAAWLRTVSPTVASHSYGRVFAPMWQHPDDADMRAAAAVLFGDDQSPWAARFLRAYNTHDLFGTPMLGVAAFRQRVLTELTKHERAGVVTFTEDGIGQVAIDNGWSGGPGQHCRHDPLAPKLPAKIVFRVCDYYAWEVATHLRGAPGCELYWPEADRAHAVAAVAAFLRRFGDRLKDAPVPANLADPYIRPRLTFPLLGRPATASDERHAHAIFALTGDVRTVKLPPSPLRARWRTYKDAVTITQSWDEKKKQAIYGATPDQQGVVWQAEEVRREGRWQRWYGIVVRHAVAKAPAAEIEFPAEGDWAELSGGIDCKLSQPTAAAPGTLLLHLRNRSGLDRALPAVLDGMTLHVRFTADAARAPAAGAGKEVPLKAGGKLNAMPSQQLALPAEEFARIPIALADWCDCSRPGQYRVQVVFHGDLGEGRSRELTVRR